VDKYCVARDDFEKKMSQAAKHFQDVEGSHLKQMREFVESYCQVPTLYTFFLFVTDSAAK
jgi:hypothetical protein